MEGLYLKLKKYISACILPLGEGRKPSWKPNAIENCFLTVELKVFQFWLSQNQPGAKQQQEDILGQGMGFSLTVVGCYTTGNTNKDDYSKVTASAMQMG